ncbi:hotdog fold thioesterase [Pleionea litopenaei]|uniref:Hotdog fold thioesterase n=1 Tax=Pleionea litopenaei TaxID=3070815 RepID=A0AA51X5C4_9GAMM|nr:hotdog fold thioesterase [Pleionea sp. HL-JVS1]WMS85733.1 hotdog fold thioesterase [Pleionea sp. HL-JVS1]
MGAIWKKQVTAEALNARNNNTLASHLKMVVEEIGDDYVVVSMPVNETTHQPMGLLHGGASVALAETVGSIASNIAVDDQHFCVGMEINANHIKAMRQGTVLATAKPLHLGKASHVWEIRIVNAQGDLVCISRLTMAVRKI